MRDPVMQVRERFLIRLHKGLARGIPYKCLPLDFMGLYALAGLETEKKVRNYFCFRNSKEVSFVSITISHVGARL